MKEFFTTYSLGDIIFFSIALAATLKSFFTFWDWGYAKIQSKFKKDFNKEKAEEELQKQLANIASQMEKIRTGHQQDKEEIVNQIKNINLQHSLDRQELIQKLDETKETVRILLESDKDDIKSWITEKHHYFCYEKKVIDDYSLDGIEKRYQHYVDEGGNSYAETLMKDIRALPKVSMIRDEEEEKK